MNAPYLDDFLRRYAPAEPVPVDPTLLQARAQIVAALRRLAAVPDSALDKPWPWRGDDADVRYGFFRCYEELEDLRARVETGDGSGQAPARPIVAAASSARWDLRGLLMSVADEDLDRDPGNGEWTVRQTLAHIVSGQRAYSWFTAWWLAGRHDADFPAAVPDEVGAELPEESTEATGDTAEIADRLDGVLDMGAGVFVGVDDSALAARARWSGYPVDVRFRLNRWASHLREHTVQVDKTLAFLGRQPTESGRLVRLIASTYGRAEEPLYLAGGTRPGRPPEVLAASAGNVAAIAESVASAAEVVSPGG